MEEHGHYTYENETAADARSYACEWEDTPQGNRVTGVIGAMLGAMIGAIPWFIASTFTSNFIGRHCGLLWIPVVPRTPLHAVCNDGHCHQLDPCPLCCRDRFMDVCSLLRSGLAEGCGADRDSRCQACVGIHPDAG